MARLRQGDPSDKDRPPCSAPAAFAALGLLLLSAAAGAAAQLVAGPSPRHPRRPVSRSPAREGRPAAPQARWKRRVELNPTYLRTAKGRECVWQLPPGDKACGVLLLAHGCKHRAVDFWDKSPGCPECIGLPEQKKVARKALEHGLAVIAITSARNSGGASGCWDTSPRIESNKDVQPVVETLRAWAEERGLAGLPFFALGSSSGGAFVQLLAARFPLAAVAVINSPLPSPSAASLRPHQGSAARHPPTLFVQMARDKRRVAAVARDVGLLQEKGIRAAAILVPPKPLGPLTLAERIEGMSKEASEAIHSSFRAAGIIGADGMLSSDPRGDDPDWRSALEGLRHLPGLSEDSLAADKSPLGEELNVLYAGHEFVSDHIQDALEWFDAAAARPFGISLVQPCAAALEAGAECV